VNYQSKYDYIIAGAGCSGLSLAMHMIASGRFPGKKILLIDKDPKQANDRTWCFWQKQESLFEEIIAKQWDQVWFHGQEFSQQLNLAPYQYKMIRGIDFYEYCFDTIKQHKNFEVCFENVDRIFSEESTGVEINGKTIYADYIFNSIMFEKPKLAKGELWLLQHFKGWTIETEEDIFDENSATLMDFRIDQSLGTAFCYVLPFNSRQALVEYTLFSSNLLEQDQYDEGLQSYITGALNISSFSVLEKEFGVIPMTNFRFSSHHNKIINIGTAGGQTKGSSGYTFNFIQKHSKAIVDALIAKANPFVQASPKRFNFYDGVLLNVLNDGAVTGRKIFTDLFKKNPVQKVLKFLDNETSFAEELAIISTLPTMPFLKSGIKQIS
jgi:lycopene beta-cyclase